MLLRSTLIFTPTCKQVSITNPERSMKEPQISNSRQQISKLETDPLRNDIDRNKWRYQHYSEDLMIDHHGISHRMNIDYRFSLEAQTHLIYQDALLKVAAV